MTDFVRVLRDARAPDLEQPEGWQARAACAGQWWLFDVDHGSGENVDEASIRDALDICAGCPVQTECMADHLAKGVSPHHWQVRAGHVWKDGRPWDHIGRDIA